MRRIEDAASNSLVLACLDGHGLHGHNISQVGVEVHHRQFCNFVQHFKCRLEATLLNHPLFATNARAAITEVLTAIEEELRLDPQNLGEYSGTTLCLAVIRGNILLVANIGDSRMVLARRRGQKHHNHHQRKIPERMSPDTVSCTLSPAVVTHKKLRAAELQPRQLSTDHKPDNREEYARILSCGGRVFSVRYGDGVVGPARVWLQGANVPGLAMSRSLGDFAVHAVGVLSSPEFSEVVLDPTADCMLVVATDGLWDFLSNEEVVRIAADCAGPAEAVAELQQEAHRLWVQKEEMADDTTVCVVFLFDHCNQTVR